MNKDETRENISNKFSIKQFFWLLISLLLLMKMIWSVTSAALNRKVLGSCQVIFHWRQTHTRKKPKVCTAQLCDTYIVYKVQRKKKYIIAMFQANPHQEETQNLHCRWTLQLWYIYDTQHQETKNSIAMSQATTPGRNSQVALLLLDSGHCITISCTINLIII